MTDRSTIDNKDHNRTKIKLGIIGTGRMAQARAKAAADLELLEVVWVCSRSRERGQEFADRYNIKKVITDWEQGCQTEEASGIVITTPNSLHKKMVLRALKNDKHVLVEYPLALTEKGALEAITAAQKSAGQLHVGLTHRLSGGHRTIKKLLPELGELGSIISIQCSGRQISRWYDDQKRMGNVFVASNLHYIDQLIDWLGEVKWVNADLREKVEKDCILRDIGSVMLGLAGGGTAYLVYARGWPRPGLGFDRKIIGEKGYIVENGEEIRYLTPDKEETINPAPVDSIAEDCRVFADLITDQKAPPYTPEDDLYSIKIAGLAYRSAREGKRIEVK